MVKLTRFTFYVFLFAFTFFVVGTVSAQTREVSDDEVNEVAKDLFCPVCESTPLDVCPTAACADWRELIRTQLAAGSSRDEVHEYFARQYGDGVLADPPKRGFNLILWIFPVIAVLAGGVFFVRYLRQLRHEDDVAVDTAVTTQMETQTQMETAVSQPISPSEAKPAYTTQIEEELLARK